MTNNRKKISRSWKVTLGMIVVSLTMIILPSFGVTTISEHQVEQVVFMVIGVSGAGVLNAHSKRTTKPKLVEETIVRPITIPEKKETQQERLHRLENDPLENLKNRLGLATSTPTSRVIDELQRLAPKSNATLTALKLTKKDFEMLGLQPPAFLS